MVIYGLEPIVSNQATVLILGSMPSVKSLEQQQYYGNKQNYFWAMLFQMLQQPYQLEYEHKRAFLLQHNIALWDVIASCKRQGSLDSIIQEEQPNDFPSFLAQYPNIKTLIFNGGKSLQCFRSHFPQVLSTYQWYQLPSTSPAHTMNKENKLRQWSEVLLPLLDIEK